MIVIHGHGSCARQARAALLVLACVALLGWCERAPAQAAAHPTAEDRAFVEWARANLHEVSLTSRSQWADLEPLRRIIGSASLVSLGEGLHGSAEPLEFRNRLFQFLVEQMGFTAIAIESGITESFAINEYVLGGPGDPERLTGTGITSGLGEFPQQAALVRWMRDFNADPRHPRKIQFYGMDISGSSGEPDAPIDLALQYLDRVDPAAAGALRERIGRMLALLKIDRLSDRPDQYSNLPQVQRDAATAVVADMIVLFETKEPDYIRATSDRSYELAYRSALAARQVDEYLRQVPVGWTAKKDGARSILGTVAVADRAKLENIEWIKAQQGKDGNVLVFAHLGHVAPTPVTVRLGENDALPMPPMVGIYLKRRYAADLVTIGHFFALDTTDCREKRDPAAPRTLEGLLGSLDEPAFVLDLRTAPPGVRARLDGLHDLYGQRPTHALDVGLGVDVMLFTESVNRATSCP